MKVENIVSPYQFPPEKVSAWEGVNMPPGVTFASLQKRYAEAELEISKRKKNLYIFFGILLLFLITYVVATGYSKQLSPFYSKCLVFSFVILWSLSVFLGLRLYGWMGGAELDRDNAKGALEHKLNCFSTDMRPLQLYGGHIIAYHGEMMCRLQNLAMRVLDAEEKQAYFCKNYQKETTGDIIMACQSVDEAKMDFDELWKVNVMLKYGVTDKDRIYNEARRLRTRLSKQIDSDGNLKKMIEEISDLPPEPED